MSSFKQLNKADITTVPYAANKRWNFSYTSVPNDSYIVFSRGKKEPFSITGSTTTNGQYQSLIYDSINHLFYQSYSGSLLDTGSLMFNINTYESASQQRPTGSYFNYNTNPLFINDFPVSSSNTINVISINQDIFGSKILPNTFVITDDATISITDDGYGNLFADGESYLAPEHIGNIFYAHGLAVITNQSSSYQNLLTGSFSTMSVSFQNEHIIYENEVRCIIRESDFNLSYNPSLLKNTNISSINAVSDAAPASLGIGRNIQTIFTLGGGLAPNDIEINYTVNITDISFSPDSYTSTAILPAGQSTVIDYLEANTTAIFSYDGTIINSAIYRTNNVLDYATGSAFQPYVTTIGLYNNNNDLLMVAKLAKPIALSSDTDMIFIVKYDI
jgi:hypothetical protein